MPHQYRKRNGKNNHRNRYSSNSHRHSGSFSSHYKIQNKISNNRNKVIGLPFVSIIVPARNEEKRIENCLLSLLNQDYPCFEIIALDDNSTDDTLKIMKEIKTNNNKIHNLPESQIRKLKIYSITDKPPQWTGKTWASEQGFLKSKGDLLLFTDADTYYSKRDIILQAILYMKKEQLDVLTGIPSSEKLSNVCSKIAMPMWDIISILFGVNSPDVNDPKSKIAYLIGSFFLIKRKAFIEIGTFESVHGEIQEDKALGIIIKQKKYKMRLVTLKQMVYTIWADDLLTLWNGIGRTVAPLVLKNKYRIAINLLVILCSCLLPFILFPIFIIITFEQLTSPGSLNTNSFFFEIQFWLLLLSLLPFSFISVLYLNKSRGSGLTLLHFLAIPFASCFVFIACLYHVFPLLLLGNSKPILWQGRAYIYNKEQQGFGI